MLNTFRVIFVDVDGNVITNPSSGGCDYVQDSDSGYYSFDWGTPAEYAEGTSSNSISDFHAFDNRSINDFFKKYGQDPTQVVNDKTMPLPDDLSEYGRTGEIANSIVMGRPTKESSGESLDWPASAITLQIKDAFAKNRASNKNGLGANVTTPSSLSNSIRVIGGNDTDIRDYSVNTDDLEFDSENPSEGNIDTSGEKFPRYIYLGLAAAGGPCGGVVSCKNPGLASGNDQSGVIASCPAPGGSPGDPSGLSKEGYYLCPSYRRYTRNSFSDRNEPSWPSFTLWKPTLGDDVGVDLETSDPNPWVNRSSENGTHVGVFLKVCAGSVKDSTKNEISRKTIIVRIKKLGKGGVNSFDSRNVITQENNGSINYNVDVNQSSTTFPPQITRNTEIEIYETDESTGTITWANNGVLSIICEGGRALPTVKGRTAPRDCRSSTAAGACADCYDRYLGAGDDGTGQDDYIDTRTFCTQWPGSEYNNLVPEITSDPSFVSLPPRKIVTKGPRFDVSRYSMFRTDEGDFVDVGYNMFGGIEGVENYQQWYDKAGRVQETDTEIDIEVTRSSSTGKVLFNKSDKYTFNGDTKYILNQNELASPLTFLGGCYSDLPQEITESPNLPFMKLDYYLDDVKVNVNGYVKGFASAKTRRAEMKLSSNGDCGSLSFILEGGALTLAEYIPSTTQRVPEPGLGAMANWVIETQNTTKLDDFHEGVGGNGGAVYVGWGQQVNDAVTSVTGRRSARVVNDGALLVAGQGFGDTLIRPEPVNNQVLDNLENDIVNQRTSSVAVLGNSNEYQNISYDTSSTPNKRLSTALNGLDGTNPYPPIGDAEAKGNDVAPIFRFTEKPEITREGDFWITAQAYHMEGIHKVTFIMDGGTPVDVYEPIEHPDNLDTDYENTASGMGRGYKEYMVRVSTAGMEHNKVHEIRAIAWPNSGYPIVLQGEKQDGGRKNSQGNKADLEDYAISPTTYPWQKNVYPEIAGADEYDIAPNVDPNTGVAKVWPPVFRDDPQMLEFAKDSEEWANWDELQESRYDSTTDPLIEYPVVSGELIPNMEGSVDHNGDPAWWMETPEVTTVAYHGFWFRYQLPPELDSEGRPVDPGNNTRRRVIYIDPSYKEGNPWYVGAPDGTYGKPYETIDDALKAKRQQGVSEDFYSAKVYIKPETYLDTNIADISNSDLDPISDGFVNGADLAFLLRAYGDTPDSPDWVDPEKMYSLADLNRDGIVDGKDLALLLSSWTGNKGTELVERRRGSVNNWFTSSGDASSGRFENAVDHDVSRDSMQNPACHFLTVEPDPTWYNEKTNSIEGYWNPDQASPQFGNEIICLPYNGGFEGWDGTETAMSGKPRNMNIHYKNLRWVSGLQVQQRLTMFELQNFDVTDRPGQIGDLPENYRHKNMSFILDSCRINMWGVGEQVRYVDGNGRQLSGSFTNEQKNDPSFMGTSRIAYPDPRDTGVNEFGQPCNIAKTCVVSQLSHPALDRSFYRSVEGPIPLRTGNNWSFEDPEYAWYDSPNEELPVGDNGQHLTPRQVYDQIGPNRQLLDPRLPGYNTLIAWDPNEQAPASLTLPANSFTRPMTAGNLYGVDMHGFNCSVWGFPTGDRWKGCGTVKHFIEIDTQGDTTGRSTGAALNIRMDIRSANIYNGKRLVTTGSNTVHGDLNQIDEGDDKYIDNRIYADVVMTNNMTQLGHLPAEGANYRRNSRLDKWRSGHKTKNWALVNIITDTVKGSASQNMGENWDHVYVRGCRLRKGFLSWSSTWRAARADLGERWDNKSTHVYIADMQESNPIFTVPGMVGSQSELEPSKKITGLLGFAREKPDDKNVESEGHDFYRKGDSNLRLPSGIASNGNIQTSTYFATKIPVSDLHWIPVYDLNGNINSADYDQDDEKRWKDNVLKTLGNVFDLDSSKILLDTCIYLERLDTGGDKVRWDNQFIENYKQFGKQDNSAPDGQWPFIEDAFVSVKYPYSMGPPMGLASDGVTPIEYLGSSNDEIDPHNSLFIPTIVGNNVNFETAAKAIETFKQGYTAPAFPVEAYGDINWDAYPSSNRVFDYVQSGYVAPSDYDSGEFGARIWFYYNYDREIFYDILKNGGWSYNKHWPEDYTPHKL